MLSRSARLLALIAFTTLSTAASAKTWVFPHVIDIPGTTATATYTWDTDVVVTYADGLPGVTGNSALVDIYLFETGTGYPILNDDFQPVCAPCQVTLDNSNRKHTFEIEQLIRDANGGNWIQDPISYRGYVVLVASGDPDAVAAEMIIRNTRSGPADLEIESFHPFEIVPAADPPVQPPTFAFPRLFDTAGTILDGPNTWDTYFHFVYAGGQASLPVSQSATVDLYLLDDAGGLLKSDTAQDICAPCSFLMDDVNRKREVELEQLIRDANGGNYLASGQATVWAYVQTSGDIGSLAVQALSLNAITGPVDIRFHELRHEPVDPGVLVSAPEASRRLLRLEAYPNPFNPRTTLHFELPFDAPATLEVLDVRGRRVRTLHAGHLDAGPHDLSWDGTDDDGREVSSGVYLARLSQSGLTHSVKVSVVR